MEGQRKKSEGRASGSEGRGSGRGSGRAEKGSNKRTNRAVEGQWEGREKQWQANEQGQWFQAPPAAKTLNHSVHSTEEFLGSAKTCDWLGATPVWASARPPAPDKLSDKVSDKLSDKLSDKVNKRQRSPVCPLELKVRLHQLTQNTTAGM